MGSSDANRADLFLRRPYRCVPLRLGAGAAAPTPRAGGLRAGRSCGSSRVPRGPRGPGGGCSWGEHEWIREAQPLGWVMRERRSFPARRCTDQPYAVRGPAGCVPGPTGRTAQRSGVPSRPRASSPSAVRGSRPLRGWRPLRGPSLVNGLGGGRARQLGGTPGISFESWPRPPVTWRQCSTIRSR